MAITYAAGAGTQITSHALTEIVVDQSQQSGNNQVIVSDLLSVAGNGNIGDGTTGIGDSYKGRLIIIDIGLSSEQRRMCISDVAGTGSTRILTVHEDWDINPVITTDTIHVPYEAADIEDGGASGGVGFASRTGLFTYTNDLTINNGGGLQIVDGTGWEMDDVGTAITFFHQSGGYFYSGYEAGGAYINGGLILFVNNTSTEPSYQAQSGSIAYIYDMLWWAQLVAQQLENAAGSLSEYYGTKFLNFTNELHLFGNILKDCKIVGKGGTTEIIRINSLSKLGARNEGIVLSNTAGLSTVSGDVTTETIQIIDVIFSGNINYIIVAPNKTWDALNPTWDVVDFNDFDWTTGSGNTVRDCVSVDVIVQDPSLSKLQDALVNVYEDTQTKNLELKLVTDITGLASSFFISKSHTSASTTIYGGHALRIDKWLYSPFVTSQSSTIRFDGAITISLDSNIVQIVQATAISDGSGITWNEDTNSSSIIKFISGSGGTIGLAVGDTITGGTSGATGIVTGIIEGDTIAGGIHLKTRNGISFSGTETINNGADGWTATLVSGSEQRYSIWIDGNTKSYQTIYDYFAALTSETVLSATGELVHEWGRDQQGRALYLGINFTTERSYLKGVFIVNGGSGNVGYFTDDTGGTWTPPSTVTVQVTVTDEDTGLSIATTARVYLAKISDKSEIMSQSVDGSGVASLAYTYTVDVPVTGWVREMSLSGIDYTPNNISGTITSAGLSLDVKLKPL